MATADDVARAELEALSSSGLLRALEPLRSRPGPVVELRPGERLINFSSNDYLGLAGDPRIGQALADGAQRWGAGAAASRLVCGDFTVHHELEVKLARFEGTEAALLFNSGYAANCGVLPSFAGPDDLVLSDELNHASIIDGCRLSRARVEVHPHRDVEAVERALRKGGYRRALVVTDTVFSMDGDRAPLRELAAVCARYGAVLVVDEAHATGVFGAGLVSELGVAVDLRMATLSKAAGVVGAHVAASRAVCELLVNRARALIYSTSLPPALACAALAAIRIVAGREGAERRDRLWRNIRRFTAGLRALGLPAREESAIVPVVVGAPDRALACSAKLREEGILVKAIRPPTVPPGTSRLRFALSAAHTDEHVDRALAALRAVM